MYVSEDRLGRIATGQWPTGVRAADPLVEEGLVELGRSTPHRDAVVRAGLALASTLGLDRGGAVRVRLPVAARALDEVASLSGGDVRARLWDLVSADLLLGIACEALGGFDVDGRGRDGEERAAVERALCLVTTMAAAQEEVDALEGRLVHDVEEARE